MSNETKEEAIAFAKWVSDKRYYTMGNSDRWYHQIASPKSSEELYKLYLQSKTK